MENKEQNCFLFHPKHAILHLLVYLFTYFKLSWRGFLLVVFFCCYYQLLILVKCTRFTNEKLGD